jgi:3-phenylpropionate/cinnamic acid dioxygenase small subunit
VTSAPGDRAEARHAITDLLFQYAHLIDAGELDAVGLLFSHATYRTVGHDVVLSGATEVTGAQRYVMRLYDGSPRTHHNISNVIVQLDATGTQATSRSYFTVLFHSPTSGADPHVILTGRYNDTFACVDGTWRFTDRLITMDQVGDLREHLRLDRLSASG